MDEKQQGWDPEVSHYFRKLLSSISVGLIWMMSMVGIGLYAGLAYSSNYPGYVHLLFYVLFAATLFLLLRFLYRKWR